MSTVSERRNRVGSGMMRVNAPFLCVWGWELDPGVLLGKPVIDRGKDLRHYVLHNGIGKQLKSTR